MSQSPFVFFQGIQKEKVFQEDKETNRQAQSIDGHIASNRPAWVGVGSLRVANRPQNQLKRNIQLRVLCL